MPENTSLAPEWVDDKTINEVLFCREFLEEHPMISVGGAFFTKDGLVADEHHLRKEVYDDIKHHITTGLWKKVSNLVEVLRMECCADALPLYEDRIHVANGTVFLDGSFSEEKDFCRNRLPVAYRSDAPEPSQWLAFLSQLLYPEDIPTLQEFFGYCLIPSTRGQKMLLITGKGGEDKSRVGIVLQSLLGSNMKTGSLSKVETSPFARADMQNMLVMLDDDMKMEALKQTNYIKSIVTAELPLDLEKKGLQSYTRRICGYGFWPLATARCRPFMTAALAFSAGRSFWKPRSVTPIGKIIPIWQKGSVRKRKGFSYGRWKDCGG